MNFKLRIEKGSWLVFLLLICMVAIFDSTLIGYKTIAVLVITAAVTITLFVKQYNCTYVERISYVFLGITILIILSYFFLGISQNARDAVVGYFYWVAITFVCISVNRIFSPNQKRICFWGIYLIILINIVKLLMRGRSLIGFLTTNELALISTAPYSTMIMFFSGIMFLMYLRARNTVLKIIALCSSILALYVIIAYLQRGIATVLGFTLIILILIVESRLSGRKQILLISLSLLFVALFITGAYVNVLSGISNLFNGQRIAERIEGVLLAVRTGDMDNLGHSFLERVDFIGNSLSAWGSSIGSILFGIGERRANNHIIGNHSEIIDFLAKYGILGLTILNTYLSNQMKCVSQKVDKSNTKVLTAFFGIYIIRGLIGSILVAEISVVMWLMLPMFEVAFRQKSDVSSLETD